MIVTPNKTKHDFHLAKTGSPHKLYIRGKDELPTGMRWMKDETSRVVHNLDDTDVWTSEDDFNYAPKNVTPIRTIIRKGSGKEIIAIFTHDYVTDNASKQVNIWSSTRGFYSARPNAVYAQTDDYEGSDYAYWANAIAMVSGRVIKTVKNLE